MLKCWQDSPGYMQFVQEKWNSFQIEGWGGYVIKEKLKWLKSALKEWHSAHAQNIPGRIDFLKSRLSGFDEKSVDGGLSVEEVDELRGITHDIHSLSRVNTNISWQQSRLLWLKDGDANSKYFHSVLSSRRRRNAIVSLMVNGSLVEGVHLIRNVIFSHFKDHFADPNLVRTGVDNLAFKKLSFVEGSSLIKPFSEEEVKADVWDCDNYKSPGPDGVNFGFLKECWEVVKRNVMRFITDFHKNGKLTRGIKTTFIALIPKVDSPQCLTNFRPISLVGCLYKI